MNQEKEKEKRKINKEKMRMKINKEKVKAYWKDDNEINTDKNHPIDEPNLNVLEHALDEPKKLEFVMKRIELLSVQLYKNGDSLKELNDKMNEIHSDTRIHLNKVLAKKTPDALISRIHEMLDQQALEVFQSSLD